MKPRLGFVIGYGGSVIPELARVISELSKEYTFDHAIVTPQKYSRKDLDFLSRSDIILVYSHGLPSEIEDLLKGFTGKVLGIDEGHAGLSNVDPSVVRKASELLRIGGRDNLRSLVLLMLKQVGVHGIRVPETVRIPWHGIYHPKYGSFISTSDYLRRYPLADRPLVGILFYRSDWLYRRAEVISKLIVKLESLGLGVLPVFTYGFRDEILGSPGSEDSVREFFFHDGRPVIDVLIKLTSFYLLDHGKSSGWAKDGFRDVSGIQLLKELNVPIIQCIILYRRSPEEWLKDERGLSYMSIVYRVSMPEVDGVIEPIVIAGTELGEYGEKKIIPIDEHIDYLARRIRKWVSIRRKRPEERRVAVILINPPCKGLEANVAVGLGLDVPESVVRFLRKLRGMGYDVGNDLPDNGGELVKTIMSRRAVSEFRWTSVEEIVAKGGALDLIDAETYMQWFDELPDTAKKEMIRVWGDPEKVLSGEADKALAGMVYNGKLVVPGLRYGNVVIVPQPKRGCAGPRCDGRVCKILHDPTIPPPHQWLAVYRWITRVFKADVIIHFGTHGYLEFLPGKSVGLSWMCWPEISIDDAPHLYVYAVSNPMEGVIAKRRGYAVLVDHLYPPMITSDVLDELNSLLTQYSHAKSVGDDTRASVIVKQLIEKSREANIPLGDGSEESVVEAVHKYVHMVRDTQVNMGLHVLGNPPKEPRILAEYVATVSAYDSYRAPSIRRVIAEYVGLDYESLRRKPLEVNELYWLPNKDLLIKLHRIAVGTLEKLLKHGEPNDETILRALEECCVEVLGRSIMFNKASTARVLETFKHALKIADLIRLSRKELDSLTEGTMGGYVEPGSSGALTRGRVDVLPTGRNFYLIDPRTLPTPAAWQVGRDTAEKLVRYYLEKHGRYPESIGEVLWSIDAYKADGEQLAQILYLLGVEPVWDGSGVVRDIRVIPLEELGRPRIDVVVRISSIVRDTLPNYITLIDKAVSKVIALDEPLEMNYVKKHYVEHLKRLVKLGIKRGRASKIAKYRVFGAPPGAYGAGVNLAIESSAWKSESDLAKIWVQWSGYAYSQESHGEPAHEALVLSLEKVDVVNRNHVSDEHDILNCCCYFAYHGGFYNAAKALKNRDDVEAVTVDTRDITLTDVRPMDMEIERVVRAKLLNKKWIDEMKRHGYRGASEFQRKILHLYGWAAATRMVKDWIFNEIAKTYVIDEDLRRWFMEHNVWALEEITRRLIEAAVRNVWKAPRELLEKLQKIYSEIEGILEEDVTTPSDIQGGSIDIITPDQVSSWSAALNKIEIIWSKARESHSSTDQGD